VLHYGSLYGIAAQLHVEVPETGSTGLAWLSVLCSSAFLVFLGSCMGSGIPSCSLQPELSLHLQALRCLSESMRRSVSKS
jgi:hypothetical protein